MRYPSALSFRLVAALRGVASALVNGLGSRRPAAPSAQPPQGENLQVLTASDFVDHGVIGWVAGGRTGKPSFEHLFRQRDRRRAQAQAEHVRIVPFARAGRRCRVGAERGSSSNNLVGGNADAGAGPAAKDSILRIAARHASRNLAPDRGPRIVLTGRERAEARDFMTVRAQPPVDCLRKLTGHIAAKRHSRGEDFAMPRLETSLP